MISQDGIRNLRLARRANAAEPRRGMEHVKFPCLGYIDKVFEEHPEDNVIRPEATIAEIHKHGSAHEMPHVLRCAIGPGANTK